jgi:hypothetical protein
LLFGHFGSQALFLFAEFGGEFGAKILGLEDLADFDFGLLVGHGVGAAFYPPDRLFHRFALPEPEASDQLLGLGEGPIDDGALVAGEVDAFSF